MEPFIEKHIAAVKTLLREAANTDPDELEFLIQQEESDFYEELEESMEAGELEVEGEQIVRGLLKKLNRLYPTEPTLYYRDSESLLATEPDIVGMGPIEQDCSYNEEDYPEIMNAIANHMDEKAKAKNDEWDEPLLCGIREQYISPSQRMAVSDKLIELVHDFTEYLNDYRPDFWNWKIDLLVLSQYVFEKAAELTTEVLHGNDLEGIHYDIQEAFSYYEFPIPAQLQNAIDASVETFEEIILDTISFLEMHDYDTCDLEIWYRMVLFKIGQIGIEFTLEQ